MSNEDKEDGNRQQPSDIIQKKGNAVDRSYYTLERLVQFLLPG